MLVGKSFVDYSWNDIIQWLKIDTLSSAERQEVFLLLMIALITLVLWQFKLGRDIIRPYYTLGVFFHELGHAIALILLGARLVKLELDPYGGGLTSAMINAKHFVNVKNFGRFRRAIASAAGFLGSSVVGGLLIIASRNPKITNNILIILGIFTLVVTILWVREWLGYGFMVMIFWGLIILAIAFRTPPEVQKLMIQFLGIQITMINFLNIRYLFDMRGYSDVAKIAKYLFLPYWFWGIMISILCLEIFIQSIRIAYFSNYFQ